MLSIALQTPITRTNLPQTLPFTCPPSRPKTHPVLSLLLDSTLMLRPLQRRSKIIRLFKIGIWSHQVASTRHTHTSHSATVASAPPLPMSVTSVEAALISEPGA